MSIIIENLDQLPEKVKKLIDVLRPTNNIWAFDAPMGAGKTTIIREICSQLGVTDTVTSPTFSIINEYASTLERSIYHFDFYRINNINEAFSIGIPDYFDSGYLCLIEWPMIVEPLLPQQYIKIRIDVEQNHSRIIKWEFIGQ